jgi:hypothetical protein
VGQAVGHHEDGDGHEGQDRGDAAAPQVGRVDRVEVEVAGGLLQGRRGGTRLAQLKSLTDRPYIREALSPWPKASSRNIMNCTWIRYNSTLEIFLSRLCRPSTMCHS